MTLEYDPGLAEGGGKTIMTQGSGDVPPGRVTAPLLQAGAAARKKIITRVNILFFMIDHVSPREPLYHMDGKKSGRIHATIFRGILRGILYEWENSLENRCYP